MPRKKYRNVVCCVGQQKKRASPRLLDMISESGIKSFPTGKKLEEKEEEEEEESRPSQFVVFLPTHLPEICLSFQLSRVNPIGTISTQRVERKLRHLIPRKRLIDKWYFMATIFVFVYLLTTIYLFWCCVICMCILKREVFKFTAWKNKKGACKNAVFKQVHIIISFLPFFIIPEFLQSLQILIKSCCTLLDK